MTDSPARKKQLDGLKRDIAWHAKRRAAKMAGPQHLAALQDQVSKLTAAADGLRTDLSAATKTAEGKPLSSAGYILLAKLEGEVRVRQRVITSIMQEITPTMSTRRAERAGKKFADLEKTVLRTRAILRKTGGLRVPTSEPAATEANP